MQNIPEPSHKNSIFCLPITPIGWWAVGIFVGFVSLLLVYSLVFLPHATEMLLAEIFLPLFSMVTFLLGIISGLIGSLAVFKFHEISGLVWLTILPLLFLVSFLVG